VRGVVGGVAAQGAVPAICVVNLERCAEITQETGRIQFDPVDLVSFFQAILEAAFSTLELLFLAKETRV